MDILSVSGVIIGLLSVVIGMIVKGANVLVLLNPAAAIIIFVGTTAALMNSFPMHDFVKIPKLLGIVFTNRKSVETHQILEEIVTMAELSRREGLLSLEKKIAELDNEFLKKGLSMVIDGVDSETIKNMLFTELEAMESRHRVGASVFTSAGSYAPTLGVLGAVIGLIGALGNLNDIEKLGTMIAAAFVATLYGIFLGYVICHPFATRLKRKSHEEVEINTLIIEGLLSLQAGENPKIIKIKLSGLLPPDKREKEEGQEKTE
jgi:chemotaxis protein MotA